MEAALRKELGISAELIKGDRGIFEVRAGGVVIYAKKECGGRFPTSADIIRQVRALDEKARGRS